MDAALDLSIPRGLVHRAGRFSLAERLVNEGRTGLSLEFDRLTCDVSALDGVLIALLPFLNAFTSIMSGPKAKFYWGSTSLWTAVGKHACFDVRGRCELIFRTSPLDNACLRVHAGTARPPNKHLSVEKGYGDDEIEWKEVDLGGRAATLAIYVRD